MAAGDGEENLAELWRSRDADAPNPWPGTALRMLGGTVAIPPAWLPPSYGEPSFHLDGSGRPTWLAALALGALVAALVGAGRRARQRSERALAAGTAVALVALAAGYVSILYAPTRWGAKPTYVRWMWPLGMVVWLVLALAAVAAIGAACTRWTTAPGRRGGRSRRQRPSATTWSRPWRDTTPCWSG